MNKRHFAEVEPFSNTHIIKRNKDETKLTHCYYYVKMKTFPDSLCFTWKERETEKKNSKYHIYLYNNHVRVDCVREVSDVTSVRLIRAASGRNPVRWLNE